MSAEKRKICVVVVSRANYGRIKSVVEAIHEHPDLELQIIVAASALLYRFGSIVDIIEADGLKIDGKVHVIVEGENPTTMAKSTGLAIIELATQFENLKPDIVLTVADRFETIATAIAATYMNITVAHTQGGEETGSIDEIVRHAITKLSHIHFASTQKSLENIIRMGENPDHVYLTGCPSIDIIKKMDSLGDLDRVMKKYKGVGPKIDWKNPYLLVIQHPVTTEFGDGMNQINETIKAIYGLKMQTVWMWPNIDAGSDDIAKGIRIFRDNYLPDFIHFYINFSPEDYICVLNNAACIVGNSSSGIREGAFLGTPCINIGSRQDNRERSRNVIDVGYNSDEIIKAVKIQLSNGKYPNDPLFGDGTAGKKIADILSKVEIFIKKRLFYS